MNRITSHLQEVDMIGKLADLKESNYKNTLMITALVELFIEKGWFTRKEILNKAKELESELLTDLLREVDSDSPLK
jgi:hypothetical protein